MRLYKYLHPDRVSVLRDGMIRFSSPRVLNDPFELRPHISAFAAKSHIESEVDRMFPRVVEEEYLKLPAELRMRVSSQQFQSFAQANLLKAKQEVRGWAATAGPVLQQVMAQTFEDMIGILCLTESPDNLLMWAHYADAHRGFVVEFDSDASFFDQRRGPGDEFRHLRKVTYSDLRPSLVFSEIKSFSPFITKGSEWSYEAEWRMMLPLSDATQVIGEGVLGIHLFAYPRTAIRSVILGCRMTESVRHDLLQTINSTDELRGVQCFQASVDEEHYRLNTSPIHG